MARLTLTQRVGAVLGGVLALGLAACSGGDGGSSTPSGTSSEGSTATSSAAPSGGEAAPGSASSSSKTAALKESDPKKALQTSEASVRGSRTVVLTLSSHDDDPSDDDNYRARSRGRIDGTNQQTTFDYGKRGKLETRIVDGTYYLKGDKRYWDAVSKVPAGEKAGLANKWLTVPQKDEHRFDGARIDRVLMSLQRELDPTGVTKSNTSMSATTHQGKPAYKVVRQDDEGDSDDTLTVVVDGTRKHLPMQATEDGDKLTFSGWDTVDPIAKPSGPSAPFPKVPNDD